MDYNSVFAQLGEIGSRSLPETLQIKIKDANAKFNECFTQLGNRMEFEYQQLPIYKEITDWLTDNKGKGLFLYGTCGQGKTLIGRYILPILLNTEMHKIVSCYDIQELNANLDAIMRKYIISIDDVGTEDMVNVYGSKRVAFAELMDAVEKHGKLIIITSNLGRDELIEKYGQRTFERIIATTKRVLFKGASLRR